MLAGPIGSRILTTVLNRLAFLLFVVVGRRFGIFLARYARILSSDT